MLRRNTLCQPMNSKIYGSFRPILSRKRNTLLESMAWLKETRSDVSVSHMANASSTILAPGAR